MEPKDYRVNPEVRALYSEPEKDEDDVYHGDNQYSAVQTDSEQKASEDSAVRLYLEPEEDEDDLYHKDVQLHFQSDPWAAAPVDVPFQRKHSEPENWSLTNKSSQVAAENIIIKKPKSLQLQGETGWVTPGDFGIQPLLIYFNNKIFEFTIEDTAFYLFKHIFGTTNHIYMNLCRDVVISNVIHYKNSMRMFPSLEFSSRNDPLLQYQVAVQRCLTTDNKRNELINRFYWLNLLDVFFYF